MMFWSAIISVLALISSVAAGPLAAQEPLSIPRIDDDKVPVDLGVVSRCPDALVCESIFNQVLPKVLDIVDVRLGYVAQCAIRTHVYGLSINI
jgi:hypothetical protein